LKRQSEASKSGGLGKERHPQKATEPILGEIRTKSYYPAFDYLRFFLAAMVVAAHTGFSPWERTGNLAVRVFFALSGWLIGGILLRSKREDLPRFYFNRATRIWIPYFAAIILLFGLSAAREPITWRWLELLLYDVTFTFNWFTELPDAYTAMADLPLNGNGGHFWSICVEEQFYLVAPIFIIFMPRLGRSLLAWLLISIVLVISTNEFAPISVGVTAAISRDRYGDWHLAKRATTLILLIFGITATLLPFFFLIVSPIFAVTIILLLARTGARSTPGEFFGGISYPIYLNHWFGAVLAHAAAKHFMPNAPMPIFGFVLGILVGAIMYLLIDRNVMKGRASYFTDASGKTIALLGYSLVTFGIMFGALRWFVFTSS
jgi:peptidoglycan/LPS O-acetylase OafA/YrhL